MHVSIELTVHKLDSSSKIFDIQHYSFVLEVWYRERVKCPSSIYLDWWINKCEARNLWICIHISEGWPTDKNVGICVILESFAHIDVGLVNDCAEIFTAHVRARPIDYHTLAETRVFEYWVFDRYLGATVGTIVIIVGPWIIIGLSATLSTRISLLQHHHFIHSVGLHCDQALITVCKEVLELRVFDDKFGRRIPDSLMLSEGIDVKQSPSSAEVVTCGLLLFKVIRAVNLSTTSLGALHLGGKLLIQSILWCTVLFTGIYGSPCRGWSAYFVFCLRIEWTREAEFLYGLVNVCKRLNQRIFVTKCTLYFRVINAIRFMWHIAI